MPQDLEEELAIHKEAERNFRRSGDKMALATVLGAQAQVLLALHDPSNAMKKAEEAEQICRRAGYTYGLIRAIGSRALIMRAAGDTEGAMRLHEEAGRVSRSIDDREGLATSLINRAALLNDMGKPQEALDLAEEADQLAQANGLESLRRDAMRVLDRIRSDWWRSQQGLSSDKEWAGRAVDLPPGIVVCPSCDHRLSVFLEVDKPTYLVCPKCRLHFEVTREL